MSQMNLALKTICRRFWRLRYSMSPPRTYVRVYSLSCLRHSINGDAPPVVGGCADRRGSPPRFVINMQKVFILLSPICLVIALVADATLPQKPISRSTKNNSAIADRRTEASHRNNLGAAYMNQQEFQRALNLFRQAATLDPKLEIAKVNQGIALVYLQKYGPARTILEIG